MPTTSIPNRYGDGDHTLFVKDGPHILGAVDSLGPGYVEITDRPPHDPLDGDHVDPDETILVHTPEAFQGLLSALVAHGTAAFGEEVVEAALRDSGVQVRPDFTKGLTALQEFAARFEPGGKVDAVAEDRDIEVEQPEFDVIVTPRPQIVVNNHFSHTVINEA